MKTKIILEFGNRQAKILVLKTIKNNKIEIKSFYFKSAESFEELIVSVKEILNRIKHLGSFLILSLSRDQLTLRTLHLPSQDLEEIDKMLSLHIIKQVPYPREEIIYDYQILEKDSLGYTRLLVAIVHQKVFKKTLDIFLELNLLPEKIVMSSQGVADWLLYTIPSLIQKKEAVLVLDIDNNFTDLIVLFDNKIIFSVSVSLGALQMIEEDKRRRFIGEVKQSLVIFQNEEPAKKIKKIFLTGPVGELEDLEILLREELKLNVEKIQIHKFIEFKEELFRENKSLKYISLAGVLGCGIKKKEEGITFKLPELEVKKEIKRRWKQLILLGGVLVYNFIVIGVIYSLRLYNNFNYLQALNKEIKENEGEARKLLELSGKIRLIKKEKRATESFLDYLYKIYKVVPKKVSLTTLSFEEKDRFVLRGYALEMGDISKFVSALEDLKDFAQVKTRYKRRKKVKRKEIVEFEILCQFPNKK